ncbi:hypothetical protein ACQ4WX_40395 [Streptomyces lasalocidi]
MREQHGQLGEREDEDQVEEEFQGGDAAPGLPGLPGALGPPALLGLPGRRGRRRGVHAVFPLR